MPSNDFRRFSKPALNIIVACSSENFGNRSRSQETYNTFGSVTANSDGYRTGKGRRMGRWGSCAVDEGETAVRAALG